MMAFSLYIHMFISYNLWTPGYKFFEGNLSPGLALYNNIAYYALYANMSTMYFIVIYYVSKNDRV